MGLFSIHAQEKQAQIETKFYVNAALGGGISTSTTFNLLYDVDLNSSNPSITVHPVGLGNGFNAYATFGFRFYKYVAVEVSMNEFQGLPVGGDSIVNLYGTAHADAKIMGRMLSVVPAIRFDAGLEKVNPYARFGLVLGVLPYLITSYSEPNDKGNPATLLEVSNNYYGGLALGYSAAGGVTFTINDHINLFTEIQFTHATWSPSHSEITQFTVNGEDKLSTLTTYEKEVDYVLTKYLADPKNAGEPRKELRTAFPFSTFAANFGISFNF